MTKQERACGRCRFWERDYAPRTRSGRCKHGPPAIASDLTGYGTFPVMDETEDCHRFEEREHGGEDADSQRETDH